MIYNTMYNNWKFLNEFIIIRLSILFKSYSILIIHDRIKLVNINTDVHETKKIKFILQQIFEWQKIIYK